MEEKMITINQVVVMTLPMHRTRLCGLYVDIPPTSEKYSQKFIEFLGPILGKKSHKLI